MILGINKYLKNFRLANQILIIQVITISMIFVIVLMICILQFNLYGQYVKKELLERIIQKRIFSSIEVIIGESMRTFIIYSQFGDEIALINKLYKFQQVNNIQFDDRLEECQNAVKIRSYQQCINESQLQIDINQINQFILFQNQILPLRQDHQLFLGYFNILLGEQLAYTTQVGQQKPTFDKNLLFSYTQLKVYNLTLAINQVQNQRQQIVYVFYAVPKSQTAFGFMINQEVDYFTNLDNQGLQVRTYIVLESGFILTDSKLEYKGEYFQNISEFSTIQFEMIKNFSLGMSVASQCEKQIQGKTLCLIDAKNSQKLIFSYYYKTDYIQFIINIQDCEFIQQIREDFNQQYNGFINMHMKIIFIGLFSILGLCIIIQGLFIIKLSRPLQLLVEIAQYNYNNDYKFQTLIRAKNRNQIEQLQDAYFDLINLSQKRNCYNKQYDAQIKSIDQSGLIQQKGRKREVLNIRAYIKKYIR